MTIMAGQPARHGFRGFSKLVNSAQDEYVALRLKLAIQHSTQHHECREISGINTRLRITAIIFRNVNQRAHKNHIEGHSSCLGIRAVRLICQRVRVSASNFLRTGRQEYNGETASINNQEG